MDSLLNPNTGLMIWTGVTFLLLVLILTKAAWKPILDGLNQRESKIRNDLDRAEKAQVDAEGLRQKYEVQLSEAQKSIQEMVSQARSEGEKTRAKLLAQAKEEAEKLLEKGRKDLAHETNRIKAELRNDIADITLAITEKVLEKSADRNIVDTVIKDSLKNLDSAQNGKGK